MLDAKEWEVISQILVNKILKLNNFVYLWTTNFVVVGYNVVVWLVSG
jgi:hypothetical protein